MEERCYGGAIATLKRWMSYEFFFIIRILRVFLAKARNVVLLKVFGRISCEESQTVLSPEADEAIETLGH